MDKIKSNLFIKLNVTDFPQQALQSVQHTTSSGPTPSNRKSEKSLRNAFYGLKGDKKKKLRKGN